MPATTDPAPTPTLLRLDGFGAPHAFTLRPGGASEGPFAGLNLGLSTGDDPDRVARNRAAALEAFGADSARVQAVQQVHGARVAAPGPGWFEAEADAMTSATAGTTLVVGAADCLPLLAYDPDGPAVGAAHCGWRGVVAGVVGALIEAMRARHGARPHRLVLALLPAIGADCYQVGPEVVAAFAEAGFDAGVARPDSEGRHRLDLAAAVAEAARGAGVTAPPLRAERCTHCEPDWFYSHRRDGRRTGRHWAMVRVPG